MRGPHVEQITSQNIDPELHRALIDKASNLLSNFKNGDHQDKSGIGRGLLRAAKMTAEQIGAKGSLDDLIDVGAHASIHEAAITAAGLAFELSKSSEDARIALASDAFSAIAVLCYGNQQIYRDIPDFQSTFSMVATLYGYAKAADDLE